MQYTALFVFKKKCLYFFLYFMCEENDKELMA